MRKHKKTKNKMRRRKPGRPTKVTKQGGRKDRTDPLIKKGK